MKIATFLGTRPEIIRLSLVIEQLDRCCEHTLVHTGQNYTANLNELFFAELGVRAPDVNLSIRAQTAGEQIGQIIAKSDELLRSLNPDRVLILGDTNSGLATISAKRLGIPVFHMEAGNRCYDDRVPEEINRRIIDHSSDVLMPYTERSRANLIREGIAHERIFVTGNPIYEVLQRHAGAIAKSDVLRRLDVAPHEYFLVTLHRAENVDVEVRLRAYLSALAALAAEYDLPVICSLHPRTKDQLARAGITVDPKRIRMIEPVGLFDFVHLEQRAFCVLSDSGTVQEECCIFKVPNVTLRDVTERPETVEVGSNVLAGASEDMIRTLVKKVTAAPPRWNPPPEYVAENVSDVVVGLLLGHQLHLAARG